jgi:hypothetical protein
MRGFWKKSEIEEDLDFLFDMSILDVFVSPVVSLFCINNSECTDCELN